MKLSDPARRILIGSLLIAFLMLLVPPWKTASYALVFDPPFADAEVDFMRLALQLVLVGICSAALTITTTKTGIHTDLFLAAKQRFSLFQLWLLVDMAMLLWALEKHPYEYYTTLRCATCFVTGFGAYKAIKGKKLLWIVLFGFAALIYNPLVKFHFERSTWEILNIVTALFCLIAAVFFRGSPESKPDS